MSEQKRGSGEKSAPQVGLRELKKRQTLWDLCLAARRLTLERGLDATTADDVAKVVGVSPRTFFNYYETKLDAVVGPVGDIGTPAAREQFIAGGPTGVLIDDLTSLYASGYEPDNEVRESISLVAEIVTNEPRVLAAFVASGVRHEQAVAELLSARTGSDESSQFAAIAAHLMSALATRAAMSLADRPDRSLAEALHDQCDLAAQLFDRGRNQKENYS